MDKFCKRGWIEINLDNLDNNIDEIHSLFPAGVYLMAVIKADAYGHGIFEVAKFLQKRQVNYLAVANMDEAMFLRRAGIKMPILVLGYTSFEELELADFYGITVSIVSPQMADEVRRYFLSGKAANLKVHIKINTGMNRLGLDLIEAKDIITNLFIAGVNIEGIFSHFSSADSDPVFTMEQIRKFSGLVSSLRRMGIDFKLIHLSNSAGLSYRKSFEGLCNMVRIGLAMYGVSPSQEISSAMRLLPILSLKSKIILIREVRAGEGIGYNHTYIAKTKRKIAIVPVGYGDGYPRLVSNRGRVIVKEKYCPIIGRVCMDYVTVDVTDVEAVKCGDEVVLIGRSGIRKIGVEEISSWCNTIPYEILCQLGRRLPRIYLRREGFLRWTEEGQRIVSDFTKEDRHARIGFKGVRGVVSKN